MKKKKYIFNRHGVARAVLQSPWFVKVSLRRRHAPMVGNGALSHKIDYITIYEEILNLEGHQNCTTGSRVTAILLNAWIFPIGQSGEDSRWRVCYEEEKSQSVNPRTMPFLTNFS